MKKLLFYLLLLALWSNTLPAVAQTSDITGEMNVVLGQSYSYVYTGMNCGDSNNSLKWDVKGGTFTTDSYGGIVVTWDCSAVTREISVDVAGEAYDYEYGYWYPTYCGSYSLTGFNVVPPTAGTIALVNNNFYYSPTTNEVCPNQPFTLIYSEAIGVQQVTWSKWDGANWQAIGVSYGPDFAVNLSSITSTTLYKAQPAACNGVLLANQQITITVRDLLLARGVVLGSRDVLFGNNAGTVTFADFQGSILNWQRSEDGGATWADMAETGEELSYVDLTTTTQFRVKSVLYNCAYLESLPCTIRVGEGGLSWVESKTYNANNQLVGNARSYYDLSGTLRQSQARNLSQGKVLATQPLFSRYDQAVGTTLAAPIVETDFTYKPRFITPAGTASIPYNYNHFDGSALNSPVSVGTSVGTLGWYYSSNNTLEPNTAVTSFPYSRSEEAPDGSTGVVRSSGVGEIFRMGQGKESVQGTFSVRSELNTYAQLRNRYFPAAVIGEQVTSLSTAATQQVGINSNGQKTVSFQDKEGHTVMVARPGHANGWENVTNTVEIGWPYCFTKNDNERYEAPVIEATADIKVYDVNNTLIFEGHARDYSLSTYTAFCRIYSNEPFRIVTCTRLNATTNQQIAAVPNCELLPIKREAYAFFNFYTFEPGSTTVTNQISGSDYTVINSVTGAEVTSSFKNNATIPAGLYQIRIEKGAVLLQYTNSYQDISYSFYNQKGQLVGSIAPNGVKQLLVLPSPPITGLPSDNLPSNLATGLVVWLPFNEAAGGTASDVTSNHRNASLIGTTCVWKPADGIKQGGLELTGSSYVYVPLAWQPTAFTVSWWTKPYQHFPYNQMVAADRGWGGFMFHTDWNGEAYVGTDLANRIVLGANTVELNTWQQFTFTFDGPNGGEGRLYKNGQLLATKSGMAAPAAWQYFTFGTGPGGNPSEGLLDDCRVYDRALSDADAKELYQAKLPFFTSYEYNTRGQLTAINETDAGRTEYYYRTDGKIRFSQSAKQRPAGYFSYTNYDDIGRPVESGECRPAVSSYFATISASATVLESITSRGNFALDQPRKEAVVTTYDLPVALPALSGTYTQDFLAGRVSNTAKYSSYVPQQGLGNSMAQTWFSYDDQGRPKWVVRQRQLSTQFTYTLDYDYDPNGKILSVCYQKGVPTSRFTHYYDYDADQRLNEVRTNTAVPTDLAVPRLLQASYAYYLHGPLKRVVIGGLQGVDYLYTAQGWLKSINGVQAGSDPGNDGPGTGLLPDLFSQELEYYAGDYASSLRPQGSFSSAGNHPERFDGTLRALAWRTPSHPGLHGYAYRYDERGQLSQADYGQPLPGTTGSLAFTADPAGRYKEGNLDYDPNGNLLALQRTDRLGAALMNINYQYSGTNNQLRRVRNPTAPTTPVIDYTYDALGQMTSQAESGATKYFEYDVSGKVTDVYCNATKTDRLAQYAYDEFGQRIRQVTYTAQGVATATEFDRDASGNEVASYYFDPQTSGLRLAEQPIYGTTRVGVLRQPRGQEPGAQLYELNDQLGNTRVVFQAPRTDTYVLTMENGRTTQEAQDFPTPDATTYNQVRSPDAARQASPYGQSYSMLLSARVGPGKKLAVAPGDRVLLEVYAAYPSGYGPIQGRSILSRGLLLGAVAPKPQLRVAETSGARPLPAWQQLLGQVSVGLAIPLSSPPTKAAGTINRPPIGPPDASLQYRLRLVRDQSIVRTGTARVSFNAAGYWELLNLDVTVDTEEPAELEVWVQNNDFTGVYFDDLRIEQKIGPIVQENHFYAFGQRNEGLSWTRQYLRGYGRGYQGQNTRFDEETGYDNFELRMYDSRLGRWTCKDPLQQYFSPYLGMGNK